MNTDEVRALALLLLPYRQRVEAVWKNAAKAPACALPRIGLLTVPQAAERLGCSRAHVYDLIAAGQLARYDIGLGKQRTKVRLSDEDVSRYIAESSVPIPRGTA